MKPSTYNGRIITDEEIQAMADEAESDCGVTKLQRRPSRPPLSATPADILSVQLNLS